MSVGVAVYRLVEAVVGRSGAYRLGRWLYLGARRELAVDPAEDGEYELQRWVIRALSAHPGTGRDLSFVDVGANVGAWTEALARTLSAAGIEAFTILSFEPAPAQRASLVERAATLSRSERIIVDPRGIAAEIGHASFLVTGAATGTSALQTSVSMADANNAIEIEVTTLDAVRLERRWSHLDLVKVDTEGNDFNVILGAGGLFDEGAIGVLQFEYNWRWIEFGRRLKDVFQFIGDRPYKLGRLTPAGVEIYEVWHFELERFIQTNYVIVHERLLGDIPHWAVEFDGSNVPHIA